MIFFTLARLKQSTKYILRFATEMQSNLKNKATERYQRRSGFIFIESKTFLDFFFCNRKYPSLMRTLI